MPFFDVQNGVTTGDQSLWNQFADALSGANDVGQIKAFAPIAIPGAPTAAVNATAGNLTGAYQYAIAFITGYWQGPVGSGTLHTQGNTGGGTASATVSPNAQQVNLSNIATGPTGTVALAIYRTKANGSSFFLVAQLNDNTSTSYTDNMADASLGAAMPTSNTTGTKFVGDGSQLTGVVTTPEVGAANGVAPLDGTGKVPTANIPALSYVPTSAEGVANGVATTDANNHVVQTANNSLEWNGANRTSAASAPSSPNPGDEWYNTSTNRKLYWNGTSWVDPLKYQ